MSANTSAAVILGISKSSPENNGQDDQGRPEVGQDFYINRRGFDECASSLSSISGGITNMSKIRFGSLHHDIESAGAENREQFEVEIHGGENTNTEDRSSLCSITNDDARKGRFSAFGRLSKFKVQLDMLPNAYDDDDKRWQKNENMPTDGSPWYTVQSKHNLNTNVNPPSNGNPPSNQLSSDTSSSPEVTANTPENELITSKQHLEELVRLPPPPLTPLQSSRRISFLDDSLPSQYCTSDNTAGGRSEGFANYVYDVARRKKLAVIFVVAMFLICIIAMTVAGLSIGQSNGSDGASPIRIEQPYEKEQTALDSPSNSSSTSDGHTLPTDHLLSQEEVSTESPAQSDVLNDTDSSSASHTFPSSKITPSAAVSTTESTTSQTTIKPTKVETSSALISSQSTNNEPMQEPTSTELASAVISSQIPTTDISLGENTTSEVTSAVQTIDEEQTPITSEASSTVSSSQATTSSLGANPASEGTSTNAQDPTTVDPTTSTASEPPLTISSSQTTTSMQAVTTTAATVKNPPSSLSSDTAFANIPHQPTFLKPSSDTSIFKNRPDNSYVNRPYLTVKGLYRASSFLKFDVDTTSRKFVSRAVLRLYSILPDNYEGSSEVAGGLSSVSVDMLPFASSNWDGSLVTWNNPVQSKESRRVATFSVEGYPYTTASEANRLQRVHEVDVTKAFSQNYEGFTTMSFKLYSDADSTGWVTFASSEWNDGFAEPELVIELSDTQNPAVFPTTSPSSTSSTPPSVSPSTTPTVSPSATPTVTSQPTPAPFSECEAKCDEDTTEKFQREFGFDSTADFIHVCQVLAPDCRDDKKQCEKQCKKDAEKAEGDALKKVEKDSIKCKEKCLEPVGDAQIAVIERHHTKAHKVDGTRELHAQ